MTAQPKVSLILPSLNVFQYIRECLDSAVSQTLKDIEIICVDAGSTDGTLEVIREYAAKDPRITVIESPVKSYGKQMNLGLERATGKYIGIIETDDWVPSNMYEELYSICEEENLDFVKADFYRFKVNEDGSLSKSLNRIAKKYKNLYNVVIDPSENLECFKFIMNTWSGIYRTSFLRKYDIKHNETPGASYQDNGFWFQTFCRAKRVMFLNKPYYMNRRDNPNSSVYSTGKVYAMRDEYDYIRNLIEEDLENLAKFIPLCTYYRFCGYYYNTMNRITPELRPQFLKHFSSEFRELVKKQELDTSLFSQNELKVLYQVLYYPEQYLADNLRKAYQYHVRESYLTYQPTEVEGPTVSIIIPVYNGEEYLRECLDTILQQRFIDFEVLCVNDGSIDSSEAILQEYAEKDSRIKPFTKENGGPSSARNFGLSKAIGKYILFVDCDDGIAPNTLSILVEKARRGDADVVVFGLDIHHYPIIGATPKWIERKNPEKNEVFSEYTPRILFEVQGARPFHQRDFVKRTLLAEHNIWFAEGFNLGEDTIFQFELFPIAHNITFITNQLYWYRCAHENSLMANANSDIIGKAAYHSRIISHIASVWKCEGYLNDCTLEFGDWAIDFFYTQFNLCPNESKPQLANDFIPILYSFLPKHLIQSLKPGRSEALRVIENWRKDFSPCITDKRLSHEILVTPSHQPFFSFIVPVRNSENTLRETLNSLLNQTFSDLEIICINDCSQDNSAAILEEYAQTDPRVKIITYTTNKTAHAARKDGVALASGQYILFCDADDTYHPEACEKLANISKTSDAEIIHFETAVIGEDMNIEDKNWIEQNTIPFMGTLKGSDVFNACFRGHLYGFTLWNKMYKASLAKNAFAALEDGFLPRGQDLYAYFSLAYHAQSYQGISGARFYQYHLGSGMDGTNKLTLKQFESFIHLSDIAEHARTFLSKQDELPQDLDIWMDLNSRLIGDCINKWSKKISDTDKGQAFEDLTKQWQPWQVVDRIASRCWNEPAKLDSWWNTSDLLTATAHNQKTIGMYYHNLEGGGVEKTIQLLTRVFMDMGYRLVLITDIQDASDWVELPEGVTRYYIPDTAQLGASAYATRARELATVIKNENIDIFIHHAWNTILLPWDMMIAKTYGASFLVYCHSVFSYRELMGESYFSQVPKVLGLADGIVCLSKVDATFWKFFNSNVHIVDNPIDPNKFNQGVSPLTSKNIVWVGRLSPEKKPEEALKVFSLVHDKIPNARLNILGVASSDEYMEKIEKLIDTLEIEDAVEFYGFAEDVASAYLNAAIFICTSECEGYGLALLDSLIFGVPVAMYELPNLSLIENNEAIFTAPFGQAEELSEQIVHLLQSDELRLRAGKAARAYAENVARFDLVQAWAGIFSSLQHKKTPPQISDTEKIMWDLLLDHYAIGLKKHEQTIRNKLQKQVLTEKKKTSSANAKLTAANTKIEKLKASNSYRIGRITTWPVRKLKRLIKKAKHNS